MTSIFWTLMSFHHNFIQYIIRKQGTECSNCWYIICYLFCYDRMIQHSWFGTFRTNLTWRALGDIIIIIFKWNKNDLWLNLFWYEHRGNWFTICEPSPRCYEKLVVTIRISAWKKYLMQQWYNNWCPLITTWFNEETNLSYIVTDKIRIIRNICISLSPLCARYYTL